MSVGPLGMAGSVAGSHLAQTSGSDTDRAAQDATGSARKAATDLHAEKAAGIGETEQDEGAADRDADGRRLWEAGPDQENAAKDASDTATPTEPRQSRDPTGQCGNTLDLSG